MCHGGSIPETWGDVSIQGLREIQKEAIIDVRFGDADAETRKPVRTEMVLVGWEKTDKDKHGQAWYYQHRKFYLFILSVDGIMGKEELVVLTTLS